MDIDRISIRERPDGRPIMHQSWGKLLFMHWPIETALLRPLIPKQLEIDTFDGSAWIGVIPFTMWGIRTAFLPPIPGTSAFHELNVRTYVHWDGVPGVWFFSLDATNQLAVWAARKFYYLPYFCADMSLNRTADTISYSSVRRDRRGPPAELQTGPSESPRHNQPQTRSSFFSLSVIASTANTTAGFIGLASITHHGRCEKPNCRQSIHL